MRYSNPRRRNAPPYKKDLFRTPNATTGFGKNVYTAFVSDVQYLPGSMEDLSTGFGPVMILEQTRRDETRDGADA